MTSSLTWEKERERERALSKTASNEHTCTYKTTANTKQYHGEVCSSILSPQEGYGRLGLLIWPTEFIQIILWFYIIIRLLSFFLQCSRFPNRWHTLGWGLLLSTSPLHLGLCLNFQPFSKKGWVKEKISGQWVRVFDKECTTKYSSPTSVCLLCQKTVAVLKNTISDVTLPLGVVETKSIYTDHYKKTTIKQTVSWWALIKYLSDFIILKFSNYHLCVNRFRTFE